MTNFEDVKDLTTEDYFEGNSFSVDAFNKKYTLFNGETYIQAIKRVCDAIASVEDNEEKQKYWAERWFDEIFNDWWHPAGSIMQGAGANKNISLSNCSTTSLGARIENENWDNLESIIRNTAYTVAKSAAFRQGQGIDFSALRPKGMSVKNSAKEGTGAVHWMKFIDSIGYYVGQCVAGDTKILTVSDGYKTIREIFDEKYSGEIFGLNGKTKIINWFKNGPKRLYKVTLENGDEIRVTGDHKIYVLDADGEYILKPLQDIGKKDLVVCQKYDDMSLYVQKIKSTKGDVVEETYDITVEDESHIYNANSIMISNSGRIPALLISLRADHPDVIEFIKAKTDFRVIQNANISVQCPDSFYHAVENDEDWVMSYTIPSVKKGDKQYIDVHSALMDAEKDEKGFYTLAPRDREEETYSTTAKAREILELIAKGMCDYAEPGIQNIDVAIRESNSDYVYDPDSIYDSKITSTNACCLTSDTKVLTDTGWMTMDLINEKIQNKELIHAMSYNIDNKSYELKKIMGSWQQRNDATVVLEINQDDQIYQIECSADHPIYTHNRGYVNAINLTSDDDIEIFT